MIEIFLQSQEDQRETLLRYEELWIENKRLK